MRDSFNRNINYARISVTDACNMSCIYCRPSICKAPAGGGFFSDEELILVIRSMAALGIEYIKLTGGEPLLRPGLPALVASIKNIPGIKRVTLTTNGLLLSEQLPELLSAGTDGINISIDSLNPKKYSALTGGSEEDLTRVLGGLTSALSAGINVKINTVTVDISGDVFFEPGGSFSDYVELAEFVRDKKCDLRFIELMPIGQAGKLQGISHRELKRVLSSRYPGMTPVEERSATGPAMLYLIPGFLGRIGFISAMEHAFCEECNRIRMTSDGFLKGCLCHADGEKISEILSLKLTEEEKTELLEGAIERVILQKPAAHCFLQEDGVTEKRTMDEIGG